MEKSEIQDSLKKLFPAPDDKSYEGHIGDLHSARAWWNANQAINISNYEARAKLYLRALSQYLPGSYKLWNYLLLESRMHAKLRPIDDTSYEITNHLFEKSLVYMNKMPRIWLDYAKFLGRQKKITETRNCYNRALAALPVT